MSLEELETRFTFHPANPDQISRMQALRALAFDLAKMIEYTVPDCREKNVAHRRVEDAVMWANAAIARRE